MRECDQYLCADLIRISTGETAEIGNLEVISAKGCTLTVQEPVPVGTAVNLQCVDCRQGKGECTACRFTGHVRSRQDHGLAGCLLNVEFDRRDWLAAEWLPRHLTSVTVESGDPR
jgi:hypothetical protein